MKKATRDDSEISITEIHMTKMDFCIVGITPLVPHAMSFKAKGQLLFPPKKKNQAEKDTTMKHEPYEEFRAAAYKFREDDEPTRLYMPGSCFHSAMAAVAIDMAGAKKAQVGRLTNIEREKLPVWGVPQIWSTIVRSSDMARTPDVRVLPILPKWATRVTVEFVGSLIKTASVANLLGAAGTIIGIGDGRPQKGKLSFGKFRVCSEDDAEFRAILKAGTRAVQDKALADPVAYDMETEELLSWFTAEIDRRIATPAQPPRKAKTSKEANGGEVHVA